MTFTVHFCQNAADGGTFLIKEGALGLFPGDDLCKQFEICRVKGLLGGFPIVAPHLVLVQE